MYRKKLVKYCKRLMIAIIAAGVVVSNISTVYGTDKKDKQDAEYTEETVDSESEEAESEDAEVEAEEEAPEEEAYTEDDGIATQSEEYTEGDAAPVSEENVGDEGDTSASGDEAQGSGEDSSASGDEAQGNGEDSAASGDGTQEDEEGATPSEGEEQEKTEGQDTEPGTSTEDSEDVKTEDGATSEDDTTDGTGSSENKESGDTSKNKDSDETDDKTGTGKTKTDKTETDRKKQEDKEQTSDKTGDSSTDSKKDTGSNEYNSTDVLNYVSYEPSSEFVDWSEKVKYSVDVPIDDLPEFITQEMIVGALKCQDETGYPASVTIAQIIQESGFGVYGPNGDEGKGLSYLAYQYNNLFGIKGTGTAGSVTMSTGEQSSDGTMYTTEAAFRVYNTYTECIEDRTELLTEVYGDLTEGVTDANTFAMNIGLRWATSLTYGRNLIQQMETYDLYRLDEMTLEDFDDMIGIFANPCPGATFTSDFGYREAVTSVSGTYHKGVDMGTGEYNIPTYAAEAGTVIYAGPCGTAGNLITIDHGNGLVTKYMHHEEIYVEVGDEVEKGQQIGLSGTTGDSTGNHLHFQVEINGIAVDPTPYLTAQTEKQIEKQKEKQQKDTGSDQSDETEVYTPTEAEKEAIQIVEAAKEVREAEKAEKEKQEQ